MRTKVTRGQSFEFHPKAQDLFLGSGAQQCLGKGSKYGKVGAGLPLGEVEGELGKMARSEGQQSAGAPAHACWECSIALCPPPPVQDTGQGTSATSEPARGRQGLLSEPMAETPRPRTFQPLLEEDELSA